MRSMLSALLVKVLPARAFGDEVGAFARVHLGAHMSRFSSWKPCTAMQVSMSARVRVKMRFTACWQRSVLLGKWVSRHSDGKPSCFSTQEATTALDWSTRVFAAMEIVMRVLILGEKRSTVSVCPLFGGLGQLG